MRSGPDRRRPLAPVAAAAGLLLALASPTPAAAQAPLPDGEPAPAGGAAPGGLELDAGVVLLTPLADLTPGGELGGGLQLSSSAGIRGGGVWWLGPRIAVGVGGSWVPADLERLPSTDVEGEPVPVSRVADADVLTASLEAVLALAPPGVGVQVEPYVVGGVGLRRLSVTGAVEGAPAATDPMVAVGGGFRTLLSDRWHLRLEARDHLSVYDGGEGGRMQHDLAISVGVGLRP